MLVSTYETKFSQEKFSFALGLIHKKGENDVQLTLDSSPKLYISINNTF